MLVDILRNKHDMLGYYTHGVNSRPPGDAESGDFHPSQLISIFSQVIPASAICSHELHMPVVCPPRNSLPPRMPTAQVSAMSYAHRAMFRRANATSSAVQYQPLQPDANTRFARDAAAAAAAAAAAVVLQASAILDFISIRYKMLYATKLENATAAEETGIQSVTALQTGPPWLPMMQSQHQQLRQSQRAALVMRFLRRFYQQLHLEIL